MRSISRKIIDELSRNQIKIFTDGSSNEMFENGGVV